METQDLLTKALADPFLMVGLFILMTVLIMSLWIYISSALAMYKLKRIVRLGLYDEMYGFNPSGQIRISPNANLSLYDRVIIMEYQNKIKKYEEKVLKKMYPDEIIESNSPSFVSQK